MITDPSIREQGYRYFLSEAPELLQVIEQELLTLLEDRSTAKVHSLMRATHTLKGGAANVGLEAIKTVAHYLEDVIKSLYNPELVIDSELQTLLLQTYECLRLPLMIELQGGSINEEEVLARSTALFAQLQEKLGDFFGAQAQIPSSVELGFDVVQSLFEMGVTQRIDSISTTIKNQNAAEIEPLLRSEAQVFIGLAESLNLPGFGAIASNIIAALDNHPDRVLDIAKIALADLEKAREEVLAGDRAVGGTPSPALLQFSGQNSTAILPVSEASSIGILSENLLLDADKLLNADLDEENIEIPFDIWANLEPQTPNWEKELEQFSEFLTSDRYNNKQPLKPEIHSFYLQAARYCLEWFENQENIPSANLSLALLVPQIHASSKEAAIAEAKTAAEYINNWTTKFLNLINNENDSQSLCLYRQGSILSVILAITKFHNLGNITTSEDYRNIPLIQLLQRKITEVAKEYKNNPPISNDQKKWLDNAPKQKIIIEEPEAIVAEESLLEEIWGKQASLDSTNSISLNSLEVNTTPLPDSLDISEINTASLLEIELTENIVPKTQEEILEVGTSTNQDINGELQVSTSKIQTQPTQIQEREVDELRVTNSKIKSENNKIKPHVPRQSVRVDLEELERLNYLAGNLLINQNRQISQDEQLQQAVQKLRESLQKHQQTLNQLREWSNLMLTAPDYQRTAIMGNASCFISNAPSSKTEAEASYQQPPMFDWLELDQYTELYNLFNRALEETIQVDEDTEAIEQIANQFSYTLEKQQRLLSHVRDDMTGLQMSPLGDILGRFPRLIEQLSTSKNKPVDLRISGGEVLVDKAIAEKLYDPLLHLVRNAFDHGIESIDVRRGRGKLEEGQIEIRAYHQGNQTIIEIRDDGKGLDFDAIRHRAVEMNFVTTEQANQLSKSQLLDFVFEPGFSTAKALSDISGRGIGLDIVKTQLQALKGSITVESQPQMGTIFSLQIPFSLTSAKFFVCHAGNSTYALLSETIAKIVLPQPDQIRELEGKKVLMYDQVYTSASGTEKNTNAIPVYKLSDLIKYNEASLVRAKSHLINQDSNAGQTIAPLLLLKANIGLFALEIDQIIGEQELVIRPLGTAIASPNYIFGCSILGDGRLILAIDGAMLIEQTHSLLPGKVEANLPMLPASPSHDPNLLSGATSVAMLGSGNNIVRELSAAKNSLRKTVLVVDDSVSHRQTLTLNLQKAGYQVVQAQDGLEALEKLRQSSEIGLVICDIEMPRMNGFEFLNHWRQDSALSKIPVVMLTSRNNDKHRMLALQLGATAYFTKPYIEQEFLGTIADLQSATNL